MSNNDLSWIVSVEENNFGDIFIVSTSDGGSVCIPKVKGNRKYEQIQKWLQNNNTTKKSTLEILKEKKIRELEEYYKSPQNWKISIIDSEGNLIVKTEEWLNVRTPLTRIILLSSEDTPVSKIFTQEQAQELKNIINTDIGFARASAKLLTLADIDAINNPDILENYNPVERLCNINNTILLDTNNNPSIS